jgi:hypothetical protein
MGFGFGFGFGLGVAAYHARPEEAYAEVCLAVASVEQPALLAVVEALLIHGAEDLPQDLLVTRDRRARAVERRDHVAQPAAREGAGEHLVGVGSRVRVGVGVGVGVKGLGSGLG